MKFSIIVPCYNVEQYIDECMQSIINQTYQDFEVILINDGSTDHTREKCEQWLNRDNRVKLITKVNGGLSSARNAGMNIAQGDYIVFVDSDDAIDEESLYQFDHFLTGTTDVLITRLKKKSKTNVIELDEQLVSMDGKELSQYEAIEWNMNESEATWPSVKSIVARRLVNKESLSFKEGIINEDIDWTTHLYCIAQNYKCCGYQWYTHRVERYGSIGSTVTPKQIIDTIHIAQSYICGNSNIILDKVEPECKKWIQNRLMRSVYSHLSYYKKMDAESRRQVVQCMQDNRKLFKIAPCVKYKLFACVLNLLGAQAAMKIYEILL